MRVLVCGGRDFENQELLKFVLDQIHKDHTITQVINGGAKGADYLAYLWAFDKDIPCSTYPADWKKHGKAAGPIRNKQMLDEGKPDLVIAFPGGKGTANMVKQADGCLNVRILDLR